MWPFRSDWPIFGVVVDSRGLIGKWRPGQTWTITTQLVGWFLLWVCCFFDRFLEEQPTSASACDTNVYQYNILFSRMFLPSESWWIFYLRQQCWQHLRGNLLTWPRVCIRFIPRRLDNQLDVVRDNPPSSLHPIRNAENNNEKLKKKKLDENATFSSRGRSYYQPSRKNIGTSVMKLEKLMFWGIVHTANTHLQSHAHTNTLGD